jgi:S1-C subfamily serine protease
MLVRLLLMLALASLSSLSIAATNTKAPSPLPKGVTLPKGMTLPNGTTVAAYIPAARRKNRFYVAAGGFWAQPGRALEDSATATLQGFFNNSFLAALGETRPYGLLLVLHPELKFDQGNITTHLSYRAYDAADKLVLEGKQSGEAPMGDLSSGAGFYRSATKAMQLVLVDVVTKLTPDPMKFAATGTLGDIDVSLLVNREQQVASGTGFYINASGQVLTAAHVVDGCVVVDVKRDGVAIPGRVVASSHLLDVAVIETGKPIERFLPLRKGQEIVLGEGITNVGYPLQKMLAASPNLTRGNVSSRGALEGSVGQFQFSAPIQPGSSGGPVVSDGGELLGVTVGTLNAAKLAESGVLPQNVNFALDARYVAQFLHKHGVAFTETEPNFKGDMRTANDAALSTVLSLSCYQ